MTSHPPQHSLATDGGTILKPIRCRNCGYVLKGLNIDSKCPECGMDVRLTVVDLIDPAASRLPRLHNPHSVGNAILWIVLSALLATTLAVLRPIALLFDPLDPASLIRPSSLVPTWLPIVAAMIALTGLWSVRQLMPPRSQAVDDRLPAVRRRILALGLGVLLFSVFLVFCCETELLANLPGETEYLARLGVFAAAAIGLWGLGGVFATIGKRSREYRTSHGSKQRAKEMLYATAAAAAGTVLQWIGADPVHVTLMATIGTAIVWISTLMLYIGLAYMVVNAWWIRRSLHSPPPMLNEIIDFGDRETDTDH